MDAASMKSDLPPDLYDRCFAFASDVYDYSAELVRLRGLPCRVAYQLFDAAGSIGANRTEAESAYSDKEFAAKNSICLKESSEARFWLRLADRKKLGDAALRTRLLRESGELVYIYARVVRKLKARLKAKDRQDISSAGPQPSNATRPAKST